MTQEEEKEEVDSWSWTVWAIQIVHFKVSFNDVTTNKNSKAHYKFITITQFLRR